MDLFTILIISLIIFGITSILSLFGKGGGEFFVPILLAFSVPFNQAATASLFILLFSGMSMTYVYHKQKMINWPLVGFLIVISSIMSFIGGFFAHLIPAIYLKILFAAVLLVSAVFIAKPIHKKDSSVEAKKQTSKWYWKNTFEGEEYYLNLLVLPLVGVIAFIAGSVGISGGGIIVPLLIVVGGLPLKVAFAVNAVLVFANSLSGFLGHGLAGEFNPMLAIPLAIAGFSGGQIGSRYAKRVHTEHLKKAFIFILVFAAIWMLANALL